MNVTVDAAVAEIERACATATQIAPFSSGDSTTEKIVP